MTDRIRPRIVEPEGYREFSRILSGAARAGRPVQTRGGGSKLSWGAAGDPEMLQLSTGRLLAHAVSERTATFGAGTPMARVHALLAKHGRMVALDPPLSAPGSALRSTIGGIVATADSGPFTHRYGGGREQLTDALVALTDGLSLRAVDYSDGDLLSLLTGSYGTLGSILEVTVVTRPLPSRTVTLAGVTDCARTLERAARTASDAPHQPAAVDFAWQHGTGGLLVLLTDPPQTGEQSPERVLRMLSDAGLREVEERADAGALWANQRACQRSADRCVLRVQAPPESLPAILAAADAFNVSAVGRAAVCTAYLTANVADVSRIRRVLPEDVHTVVTDIPQTARGTIARWEDITPPVLARMRAVKARFDPDNRCNPGVFVGGI